MVHGERARNGEFTVLKNSPALLKYVQYVEDTYADILRLHQQQRVYCFRANCLVALVVLANVIVVARRNRSVPINSWSYDETTTLMLEKCEFTPPL